MMKSRKPQYTCKFLYILPENFNYFDDKSKIKKKLKEVGFNVESIQSWLEDTLDGTKKTRHTVFIVNITEAEE